MNTPTHVIAAAAILAKSGDNRCNMVVMAGALIPDLSIYALVIWAALAGRLDTSLWSETYWSEPWQTLGAVSNSVPLALVLLAISVWRAWPILGVFAAALLVHAVLDLPVHADDAHRHFWPVTDWRFVSPISYWDSDHHGAYGRLLDCVILLAGIAVLWRRFETSWVRWLLGLLAAMAAGLVCLNLWLAFAG
ncbi:MAG: cobalamin biosynthesis protein CobQ [Pseudomonadota bacterium]